MPPLDETNETIKRALAISRGNPQQALGLLEQGLRKSRATVDRQAIRSLARNAGVICVGGVTFGVRLCTMKRP